MNEILKRIYELESFRRRLLSGKNDPEVLPAAIDWLDCEIAELKRDRDVLLRNQAA